MASIRGILYPLAVDSKGGLAVSEDLDLIRRQIHSVIETRNFERVMQPEYGTPNRLFDGVTNPLVIANQLQAALEQQISQTQFTVDASYEEVGALVISIGWSVDGIPQPAIGYRLSR